MPELDGLQATQRIRRLEEKLAAQRGASAAEPEAAAARCDASRSGAAGGVTGQIARVPIIAVSSCSETDQLLSPALADVDTTTGAPPSVNCAVFAVSAPTVFVLVYPTVGTCTFHTHRGLGWSLWS